MSKSIVLTGGGTAGHVMPNIALLPELEKHFDKIYYIGSKNGIEKNIIKKYDNIKYYSIDSAKLIRKITLKNLMTPFILMKSIYQCIRILKDIKPSIVFSKGGYVAVPVVIAAKMLKIPIIAHESDSTIGLANKIIYKFCNTMFFSFEEAMKGYKKKGKHSGSPIRKEFFKPKKHEISETIDKNKKTIVIVGGSLGSQALNKIIVASLPKLSNYNIINIVGKGNIDKNIKNTNYYQYEFIDDIAGVYNLANIVISRAGSNTIFELLAMKKLMILVPLPKDESRGDQIINAQIFEKNGWAKTLNQKELTTGILINTINQMLLDKSSYVQQMSNIKSKNSVNIITKEILSNISNIDNK